MRNYAQNNPFIVRNSFAMHSTCAQIKPNAQDRLYFVRFAGNVHKACALTFHFAQEDWFIVQLKEKGTPCN
jgi:hypothetical protein